MKSRKCLIGLALSAAFAIFAPAARADAFRCGSWLIREGMPSAEIEEKCGKPELIRRMEESVYSRLENGNLIQTGVETSWDWFYERGPNEFVARIRVRAAIAEKIELLTVRRISELPEE